MRWFEDGSCLITWMCFLRLPILGLTWIFIILWFFYFSLRCQCNFGPFSDFYELNVYVEILNTLDWYYLHFFRYLTPGVSLFRLKISFHQPLYSFFWHFLFFELGWGFLYFLWLFGNYLSKCQFFLHIEKLWQLCSKKNCHKVFIFSLWEAPVCRVLK